VVTLDKKIVFGEIIGKINELGFSYKKGKERTAQQHSKKRKLFKFFVLPKARWNKKRGRLEKTKKGSRTKKVAWID